MVSRIDGPSIKIFFLLSFFPKATITQLTPALSFALFFHLKVFTAKIISTFFKISGQRRLTCSPWQIELVETKQLKLCFVFSTNLLALKYHKET